MAQSQAILCPYCGEAIGGAAEQCAACGGFLDELSRRVTQQQMGPWFIRDRGAPYRPGCSYAVLRALVERGKVKRSTIVRGPTTGQFWSLAGQTPGVAHLLGVCHGCGAEADPGAERCGQCGAEFEAPADRQRLGLDADAPEVLRRAAPAARGAAVVGAANPSAGAGRVRATAPGDRPADLPADAAERVVGDRPSDDPPAEPSGSTSWLVWLLVALNVLLILAVTIAIALHMLGE